MSEAKKQTVSLVLGSGGARGLAHIGVIRYLQEDGYDIRSIAGCSMGAVVGGIYAAGKLDEYEKWVCAIDRVDIVSLLDFSWQRDGLVKGDKIIATLKELVGDCDIEELPIRYTAVATDFRSEKEVWLQKGSLFDAMRASMSLPLFFTPVKLNGRRLIDGGVLNPVPIAPTLSDHTDLTIAVNLGGEVRKGYAVAPKSQDDGEEDEESSVFRRKISDFLGSMRDRFERRRDAEELSAVEISSQAFEAMQGTISRQKLAAYPPDRLVTIPRNAAGVMDFDRARGLIDLGFDEARKQLAERTPD